MAKKLLQNIKKIDPGQPLTMDHLMDAVQKGDQIFCTEEDMTTEEKNAISYFAE